MTLKEANYEVEQLEADLRLLLCEKEEIENELLPKSTALDLIKVDGGKRVDRYALHEIKKDSPHFQAIVKQIEKKERRKDELITWIDTTLKLLNKYDKVLEQIVHYKENCTRVDKAGKLVEFTWEEISQKVHYSKTQCRNIYRKYRRKRDL